MRFGAVGAEGAGPQYEQQSCAPVLPPGLIQSGGPAMSDTRRAAGDPELTTYRDVQLSPDFSELRRRFRRFVFPMTGLFLVWYFLYVLLADYAHGFMSH